jgi:hypothetical protein
MRALSALAISRGTSTVSQVCQGGLLDVTLENTSARTYPHATRRAVESSV